MSDKKRIGRLEVTNAFSIDGYDLQDTPLKMDFCHPISRSLIADSKDHVWTFIFIDITVNKHEHERNV